MVTLYDAHGNKVKTSALTKKDTAAPTLTGIRTITRDSVVAGLTPEVMAGILQDSADGDLDDLLTLAEEMEERDLHYASVLGTRKHAVSSLPISVDAKTDDARDVEIKEVIRETIVEDPYFLDLLEDLLDGLGKGFSIVEMRWVNVFVDGVARWYPEKYSWRDPHSFIFDRETQQEPRIKDESAPTDGLPLPPFKFITHYPRLKSGTPGRGGLARLIAVSYMCKAYTLKDWLAFVEVFGMPIRVGTYGPGATEDDQLLLAEAVANLASDAGAIIPESMRIEFVESGGGKASSNDAIFKGMAEYIDKAISKAVLGQTMTTEDGSSQSQATVHDGVRHDILRHDARQLTNTINKYLVKPFVDLNFGAMPRNQYPIIKIFVEEPEDLVAFTAAVTQWVDRGLTIEMSVIRDKFGIPEPEEGADVVGKKTETTPADPGGGPDNNARRRRELNAENKAKAVDEIVDSVASKFVDISDSIWAPIFKAINEVSSLEELQSVMSTLEIDKDELTIHLATQMFKARGLGNAETS